MINALVFVNILHCVHMSSLAGVSDMEDMEVKKERVARQLLLALRARALAKFGEVDTVPVSENSLKYNTFC